MKERQRRRQEEKPVQPAHEHDRGAEGAELFQQEDKFLYSSTKNVNALSR